MSSSNEQRPEIDVDQVEEILMDDINLDERTVSKPGVFCNSCTFVGSSIAVYICYMCGVFLCGDCFKKHESHEWVWKGSEGSERAKRGILFLTRMRANRLTSKDFFEETIQLNERVNVKCVYDKVDCFISGLCGLRDKHWLVLDHRNMCMKMFNFVTNRLIRYIKFGSRPCSATEIILEKKSKELSSNSSSVTHASTELQEKSGIDDSFLSVTFPYIKQIWFIDINKKPAVKIKTITTNKFCWSTYSTEDKILTLCRHEFPHGSQLSVDIMSTNGNWLKVVENFNFITEWTPSSVVYRDTVYITDWHNHKVFCCNIDDGRTISQVTIDGSWPEGIVIHSGENIYMCGRAHNELYKLSQDLLDAEPLKLGQDITRPPDRLCSIGEKLFIGHSHF